MDIFHVLNRGVDKRSIFLDTGDRQRFVDDLFIFNSIGRTDPHRSRAIACGAPPRLTVRPEDRLVYVHAFCLMSNHYHLLLSSAKDNSIPLFMQKLDMGYTKYFNEKNERRGALFEAKYKRVHIEDSGHFLHIPFYIHMNPLDMIMPKWRERALKSTRAARSYLEKYHWSSHRDYLGISTFPHVLYQDFLRECFDESGGYRTLFEETLADFSLEPVHDIYLE